MGPTWHTCIAIRLVRHRSTPGVELGSAKDVLCLKYYNTLEWESKFTLELNDAKNIDCIQKLFEQKLCKN